MAHATSIDVTDALRGDEVDAVAHLVERVTESDGVRPLSEQVTTQLLAGQASGIRHLRGFTDEKLVAYASIDLNNPTGATLEIALDPQARADGIGGTLLDHALRETGGRLDMWVHGEAAAAGTIAESRGFSIARTLYRMRRTLLGELPVAPLPVGVRVRSFEADTDGDRWLELNARAFADLPDQGRWTKDDLATRERADWFDPDGFLLAEALTDDSGAEDGALELVGFHWTKVHRNDGNSLGEVYVLGIEPRWHGRGLGRALTVLGMEYLKSQGLTEIILYVDAANTAAIKTYERLGFARYEKDVLYSSPVPARPNEG